MINILTGDALPVLCEMPDRSVHCCVTSPPYFGLRDYGVSKQIGLEKSPDEYIEKLVKVFQEVRRVLKNDGTLWVNLGDSYAGSNGVGSKEEGCKQFSNVGSRRPKPSWKGIKISPKNLMGIPWRVAFALQDDGWILRQDIIWHKPNPMPESVRDRCTKAHEYIFMFSKKQKYFYNQEAIKEPASRDPETSKTPDGWDTGLGSHGSIHKNGREKGRRSDKQRGHSRRHAGFNERWDKMTLEKQCSGMRNKRSVWTVATRPFKEAHFATFPPNLIEPCILAGCPQDGVVLDPFSGSGTTGLVAVKFKRKAILIELNPVYAMMSRERLGKLTPSLLSEK